jgi:hypothetical protein
MYVDDQQADAALSSIDRSQLQKFMIDILGFYEKKLIADRFALSVRAMC